MDTDQNHIDQLILRYCEQTATEDALQELNNWVQSSPENAEEFHRQVAIFRQIAAESSPADLTDTWNTIARNTRPKSKLIQLAAVISIAASIIITAIVFFKQPSQSETKQLLYSASGSVSEIILADSSKISLNTGSQLQSPRQFDGNTRQVQLHGTAFFEVAHNPQVPFIVETDYVQVKVLGTSFSIEQDSLNGSITIALITGSVQCTDTRTQSINRLQPGEQIRFYKDTAAHPQRAESTHMNPLAWKRGSLIFSNTPLSIALTQIEDFYGKKIILEDSSMYNCKLNAKLTKNAFDEVLAMFDYAFNFEIKNLQDSVVLSGQACPPASE